MTGTGQLFQPDTNTAALDVRRRYGAASPPFTILNTNLGPWRERKAMWNHTLGLSSTDGRDAPTYSGVGDDYVSRKIAEMGSGPTSVFDPALMEALVTWYTTPGDAIVDPFAGGSVRGIVAGAAGRAYVGVDLSETQVAANRQQREDIMGRLPNGMTPPVWHVGDALDLPVHVGTQRFDAAITCPPYYDLEVYSDDERDLSTMDTDTFDEVHAAVIGMTVATLRPNRFAVWVVGSVRDKRGALRSMVAPTVAAFTAAGATFYDEAILYQTAGTAPLRVGRQWEASRKLARIHQHVLVFVVGNPKSATARMDPVT